MSRTLRGEVRSQRWGSSITSFVSKFELVKIPVCIYCVVCVLISHALASFDTRTCVDTVFSSKSVTALSLNANHMCLSLLNKCVNMFIILSSTFITYDLDTCLVLEFFFLSLFFKYQIILKHWVLDKINEK